MPADEIIRDDPVDEQRKLAAGVSLAPALLPVFDHGIDRLLVLALVRAVRFGDGGAEERRGGELLRFIDAAHHMHFRAARCLDGHFLEVGADGLAERPPFFHITEQEGETERQKTHHHDRRDDFMLEAVRPTPECHTDAPSRMRIETDGIR